MLYSVLSDICVKNELCIRLESESNVLSSGNDYVCQSPPSKLRFALCFLFCLQKSVFVQCYTVPSDFRPMTDDD